MTTWSLLTSRLISKNCFRHHFRVVVRDVTAADDVSSQMFFAPPLGGARFTVFIKGTKVFTQLPNP